MQFIYTFCQRCHMRCRLKCQVLDEQLVEVSNLMGIECPRGYNTKEIIYHSDRLRYPLMRTGHRGEKKWMRVSWKHALEVMADKFGSIKQKYGVHSLATVRGSGHKQMARMSTLLFSHIIGTPNVLDV